MRTVASEKYICVSDEVTALYLTEAELRESLRLQGYDICTAAERKVLEAWAKRAWALCSRVAEETCEAELSRRAAEKENNNG